MNTPLFLASKSPRRQELLQGVDIRFRVHVPQAEEKAAPAKTSNAKVLVRSIAAAKAEAAFQELKTSESEGLILAADTLVFLGREVLGKPTDSKHAKKMLSKLSGHQHTVITAVCLLQFSQGKILKAWKKEVITKVHFRKISAKELTWYLNTPEPYDKAGAYGAQGIGASFIQKIIGSYSNVVGLPLSETLQMLGEVSAAPWQN